LLCYKKLASAFLSVVRSSYRVAEVLKTITATAAAGAHHSVLSPDERYLFIQNSLLTSEGLSDRSITVTDLTHGTILGSIDTLKAQGYNPNCIMRLPNHFQPGGLRAGLVGE
jgi:hypothetical protein